MNVPMQPNYVRGFPPAQRSPATPRRGHPGSPPSLDYYLYNLKLTSHTLKSRRTNATRYAATRYAPPVRPPPA